MSSFLETMASRSHRRAAETARSRSLGQRRQTVMGGPPPRSLGTFGSSFDLIGEVKPRSPSEGVFPERSHAETARAYEAGGAGIISVLTEPSEFGGSVGMLQEVTATVSVPVLAKDFLVDPIQVYEAREAGADGVLVIVRILSAESLIEILDAVSDIGIFALLEGFDRDDLELISEVSAGRDNLLAGVNCRDLDTLEVMPERHVTLAANIPGDVVTVAESAIGAPADIERIAACGYRAALVGSALMRADDPAFLVSEMVNAGRRAMTVPS
ncbi:MAG: indole-3-glycerol phosphate synthase TrpC [Acidimicrobiia bacterium]